MSLLAPSSVCLNEPPLPPLSVTVLRPHSLSFVLPSGAPRNLQHPRFTDGNKIMLLFAGWKMRRKWEIVNSKERHLSMEAGNSHAHNYFFNTFVSQV